MKSKNRTSAKIIDYGLYLYFLGLPFRNTTKALSFLKIVKISYVSIWNWIQKCKPKKNRKNKKILEFIIDETAIKVGFSELTWLWIVIEPIYKEILAVDISKERNMFVAERFLSHIFDKYGKPQVSSDGSTWYPQPRKFLNLSHHLHSPFEKSIIERTMQ
jgi:putative transposase